MTKALGLWTGALLFVVLAASLALGATGPSPAPAAAQRAPATIVATAAISLSPTADLSGAAPADTAETPGELLAAYIVFAVVGIVVAVTAYLVWRTRPKR